MAQDGRTELVQPKLDEMLESLGEGKNQRRDS